MRDEGEVAVMVARRVREKQVMVRMKGGEGRVAVIVGEW